MLKLEGRSVSNSNNPSSRFESMVEQLAGSGAFERISASKLKSLVENARICNLMRGSVTRFSGLLASDFYVFLQGMAQVTFFNENGRQFLSTVLGTGAIFGGCSAVLPKLFHSFQCRCLRNCTIARLDPEELLGAVIGTSVSQFSRFQQMVAGNLLEKTVSYSGGSHRSLRERLAMVLLDMTRTFGVRDARGMLLNVRITHDILATIVGASRQRVTIHLNEFARAGLIKRDGRRLLVVTEELQKLLDPPLVPATEPSKKTKARENRMIDPRFDNGRGTTGIRTHRIGP